MALWIASVDCLLVFFAIECWLVGFFLLTSYLAFPSVGGSFPTAKQPAALCLFHSAAHTHPDPHLAVISY